ncbi:mRNA cap guanine-N7 methyltransferase [Aspergillus udagawae]|uniref:mRNA cap guanine-N(7) methyltransferase n=1 Tax=Aspergillus udagawae TaxID=91492 RepID=A0ABQ1A2V1_9EURO|nr:mRNA cap guanine-N7 methyltransferase [Aspergillus udagawae]
MYDPARDSWDERDGDEARSRRGRLASDQPHAGFSSSDQVHNAIWENNNTTVLRHPDPDSKTTASTEVLYAESQPAQPATQTPPSISTHLQSPANLAAQVVSHTRPLTSAAEKHPNKATTIMENRSDSATPKPRADSSDKLNRPDEVAPPTDQNGSQGDKKRKVTAEEKASEKSQPAPDRPVSKRKRMEERHQKLRKRGRAPPSAYSRRDADETASAAHRNGSNYRSTSPLPPPRSPTPEEQPRQRKRPGGGARMGLVDRETLRRRQEERDRAQVEEAMRASQGRGVADVVRQHYNAVPQRGREWRKTESKIKGLRSFNNWVKSTLIQKFSPDEEFLARFNGTKDWAEDGGLPPVEEKRLLVIDLGCGKGGDLGKWQLAPQPVDLYVGLDPAEVSIVQARERYNGMKSGRGNRGRRNPIFHAEFQPKDCFGEWLGDVDIVQQVGIDPNVGPGGSVMSSRWGGGGFDVVASMFTIHYAFESEEKTRQMLRNVAGCLKKGGRFLGVCPNSDVISARVAEINAKKKERQAQAKKEKTDETPEDGEVEEDDGKVEWGNQIYRVRFPATTPEDGIFRPPFGWRYSYFMEEAVEEVPEYVVPWEAFRALTEDYNLELQYRKPFLDIWRDEKDDPELGPLSERMGVRDRATGELLMTEEEKEAASFYHAFCFYKV